MLSSVVPDGITTDKGGFYAISVIYSFLLQDFNENVYSNIFLNQIGDELNEFISKQGHQVKMNYRTIDSLKNKTEQEKNILRLEFIHNALCLIADKYGELHIRELDKIKEIILKRNFIFEFILKKIKNNKSNYLVELSLTPLPDNFKYFLTLKLDENIKCKVLIYNGLPAAPAYNYFFKFTKWRGEETIVLWGIEKEVETVVNIKSCTVKYTNLTEYKRPPLFEMLRFDTTEKSRDIAHRDWKDSLPDDSVAKSYSFKRTDGTK